jgi:hypothetical protein
MRDNGRVQTLRDCHPFALLRASAYLVARNDNLAAGGAAIWDGEGGCGVIGARDVFLHVTLQGPD